MKRIVCVLLVLLMLLSLFCSCREEPVLLEMHFLDVGQGDCVLLRCRAGDVLIDSGPVSERDHVLFLLSELGVESLELAVFTHFDEDHIGGGSAVLSAFPVKEIWIPEESSEKDEKNEVERDFLGALEKSGTAVRHVSAGVCVTLGRVTLSVLAPLLLAEAEGNDGSIVVRVECGDARALFMGDAEEATERRLLSHYGSSILSAELIKVGHHGSSTSSTKAFLGAVDSSYAVISCAAGNDYGQPHGEVLARFEALSCEVLRTDLCGTVVFTCDGKAFTYEGSKEN